MATSPSSRGAAGWSADQARRVRLARARKGSEYGTRSVAGKISKKNSLKRLLEKEIGEAPPSPLERVGLLAERVARLRLARARRVCHYDKRRPFSRGYALLGFFSRRHRFSLRRYSDWIYFWDHFWGFSKGEILAMIPVSFNRYSSGQTLSSRTKSASIALREASKNVAENVPRLILFAMLASVSCKPCFLSRSASSRYPTSARANSALRNRFARSSQEGDFVVIGILSHLDNTYHIR